MKKIIYVTLLATIAISVFYACKKDSGQVPENKSNVPQYTEYEWQVYYKLQDLKQKLNSGERGLDPISLSEAEWYMETNFNVEEARTEDPVKLQRKDTTYYTLPLFGANLAEYSDINTMYNEMLQDLDSLEYVIADPSLMPMYASLNLIQNTLTSADFMLITGFGSYYSGNYPPFYSGDDWTFGNMGGHCDGTLQWQSDGGQELKNRLNNPFFQWAGPGSFVDIVPDSVTHSMYPDVNNQNPDPNVDYMVFYEERSTPPCLEDDELTFYLNRAHEILYTYETQFLPNTTLHGKRPEGKSFIQMDIFTPTDSTSYWEHKYFMNYGVRVNLPIPD